MLSKRGCGEDMRKLRTTRAEPKSRSIVRRTCRGESLPLVNSAHGMAGLDNRGNVSPMDPAPPTSTPWPSRISHFRSEMWPNLSGDWLGAGFAVDYLASSVPDMADAATDGLGCGQLAFAAFMGLSSTETRRYFPDRKWTNRRDMESALREAGWQYEKRVGTWPQCGLCLIHWTGPWTARNYAPAILQRTHWIAVIEDFVFDCNWGGWLPKESWEDVVVDTVLRHHSKASGWTPLSAFEIYS